MFPFYDFIFMLFFEGERLKVLRVEENCLATIPSDILQESKISVISADGNMFTEKELQVAYFCISQFYYFFRI